MSFNIYIWIINSTSFVSSFHVLMLHPYQEIKKGTDIREHHITNNVLIKIKDQMLVFL